MGDGGVACAPSQHLMERFPISETFCGGSNGGFSSKASQLAETLCKPSEKNMGIEKEEAVPRRSLKSEVEKGRVASHRSRRDEVEKGEIVSGEQSPRDEFEKGEIVSGKSRKWELENGELVPERWQKGELESGEFVPEKWRREDDKGQRRGRKGELENGEFVPDKSRRSVVEKAKGFRGEEVKDEYGSGKVRNWELEKGEIPPESGSPTDFASSRRSQLPSSSNLSSRRDVREVNASRSAERRKRPGSRWGTSHAKELKSGCSRADDKLESSKNDYNRKYHGDHNHPSGAKYRRLSDDNHSSSHSEKLQSRRSVERPHRNSSSSSRVSSFSRYESPRHYDAVKGTHERHGRSPAYSERERSPRDRARQLDYRDRSSRGHHDHSSPGQSERSSHDRSGRCPRRGWSPVHLERSPHERSREHREHTPKRSPGDSGSLNSTRKANKSKEGSEKPHSRTEEKTGWRDTGGRVSQGNSTARHTRKSDSSEKSIENESLMDKELQHTAPVCDDRTPANEGEDYEELPSMEEDMDICDTPPHVHVAADLGEGKWFYLDYNGIEQGPAKLCDLKQLVEGRVLQTDHMVKHSQSDRWVTVENASSPLISVNFSTIVSDAETQLVNPPEAPGNLLLDSGDFQSPHSQHGDNLAGPGNVDDLHIDERIGALMKGHTLIPGRELEAVGEALNVRIEHVEWEKWSTSEDMTIFQACSQDSSKQTREEEYGRAVDVLQKENFETRSLVIADKEYSFCSTNFSDWCPSQWTCKGGDWKRNDEVAQDRTIRRKNVLNEGYPLCQMQKTGNEDPRQHRKDDLYLPSRSRRLDLPFWAYSWSDEQNDSNSSKSCQTKSLVTRGAKGTMLPVVRINACVVRDRGSVVCDSRSKHRGSDRHSSLKPVRSLSGSNESKGSSTERVSRPNISQEPELSQPVHKSKTVINTPRDRVCRVNELELSLGEWFYLDGAGHEHGPASFLELHTLAAKGVIEMNSSIFRKVDKLWVPITDMAATSSSEHVWKGKLGRAKPSPSSFHKLHPQFVGYMRGKLHELVMKSYRSREFAAAINEVLDPWISAKQPRKEIDKQFAFNSTISKDEDYSRSGKRIRFLLDGSEEADEIEEDFSIDQKDDLFEDICGEMVYNQENVTGPRTDLDGWGLLDCRILARVFHFLRADFKSLALCAATCKRWNGAVKAYRSISKLVDFSYVGPACTDAIFNNIMLGFDKNKVTFLSLRGCSNINVVTVEEILQSFHSIEVVDIRNCSQLGELNSSYKNVKWIRSKPTVNTNPEDSYSKIRSLKQLAERSYLSSRAYWRHLDEPNNKIDSFNENRISDGKLLASNSFRQSCYKHKKLFGPRKASAVLSRDAHLRRWLHQKSENGYKKMEERLASTLKDIMKKNTCEFFVPKVAEIEDRMKNGYYISHGLSSIKEDISQMCRAAFKSKSYGDKGDMNRIIMLFIQLIRSLEENPRLSSNARDEMTECGFSSTASKYRKKLGRTISEKKNLRSNGSYYGDSSLDYSECASDREIKRRLNKLNRKTLDSESETSDDLDPSEEDSHGGDGDATNSDTESDVDLLSGRVVPGDSGKGFSFAVDEPLDSMTDEREWGARMTKASLVPPVTRKYEVIGEYVITADKEKVQQKMRVSLPDDYAERFKAQKNNDEPDPDFPEVKEYKPRKELGDEVLEQEVYGIDPYTFNLLIDSMPEEMSDWTVLEKHMFVEELLLRTLNKQVRHFTGTGNTPMTFLLQPVLEEIQRTAERDGDRRILKLCQNILKAIRSRPEDSYVAYRKGLGVVCNKEEGFNEDDFVVEFLGEVYPAWRWFEKQDGIRSLQKNNEDPAPEFYNIYLERPKHDSDGYDLVVVDAMHKANYASRICHSCRPNCEAKVTAVNGQYQIGIYAVRPIAYGEEITFDYNSVTESKEEYEASVCLCGSQVCRGSYLNLTGENSFQKVLKECHGILDRHGLMLEACELNYVTEDDYLDLGRAGLGSCLLSGLPDWLIAYSARLVRFINFERTKLPEEILNYNLEEKRKFYIDISLEVEKGDAEIQAEGVYNQRLQNLAITLDKVGYVMRSVYGDPRKAPPPLEKLSPEALVSALWKGQGSLVDELLQCMAPHMEEEMLNELKSNIDAHDPSGSSDVQKELRKSLLWLRDEIRNLPCSPKCRHDAAADLIHVYAHTKYFFRVRGYKQVTSEPVYISPLDLGPKYADKMGPGFQEYLKTYGENYCLGQLIYWHNQTNAEPDCRLVRSRQGCLLLPHVASFYFKSQKSPSQRVYGRRTLKFMLSRMVKQPQRPWPEDRIWQFKSNTDIFGSPMLDAVLNKSKFDKEMVHWLKTRPSMYQAPWDR